MGFLLGRGRRHRRTRGIARGAPPALTRGRSRTADYRCAESFASFSSSESGPHRSRVSDEIRSRVGSLSHRRVYLILICSSFFPPSICEISKVRVRESGNVERYSKRPGLPSMPKLSTCAAKLLPSFENWPSVKTDIGPPEESIHTPVYAPFIASKPVRPRPRKGWPMNEPVCSVTSQKPPQSRRQTSLPFVTWPIIETSASQVPTQASRRFTSGGRAGAPVSCRAADEAAWKIRSAERLANRSTRDTGWILWDALRPRDRALAVVITERIARSERGLGRLPGRSPVALRREADDRAERHAGEHDLDVVVAPVRLGHRRDGIAEDQTDHEPDQDPLRDRAPL